MHGRTAHRARRPHSRSRGRSRRLKGGGGGGGGGGGEEDGELQWLNPPFGSFDDFATSMVTLTS